MTKLFMRISAIAIISKNRGLGFENHLLFHIPGELPRFKKITMGHPVIMGRKTHESIGRDLPGRYNIVLSRSDSRYGENCIFARPEIAYKEAYEHEMQKKKEDEREIFIIGGEQTFRLFWPVINRLYLTVVDTKVPADTFFPEYEKEFTKHVIPDEEKTDWEYPYTFLTLER